MSPLNDEEPSDVERVKKLCEKLDQADQLINAIGITPYFVAIILKLLTFYVRR